MQRRYITTSRSSSLSQSSRSPSPRPILTIRPLSRPSFTSPDPPILPSISFTYPSSTSPPSPISTSRSLFSTPAFHLAPPPPSFYSPRQTYHSNLRHSRRQQQAQNYRTTLINTTQYQLLQDNFTKIQRFLNNQKASIHNELEQMITNIKGYGNKERLLGQDNFLRMVKVWRVMQRRESVNNSDEMGTVIKNCQTISDESCYKQENQIATILSYFPIDIITPEIIIYTNLSNFLPALLSKEISYESSIPFLSKLLTNTKTQYLMAECCYVYGKILALTHYAMDKINKDENCVNVVRFLVQWWRLVDVEEDDDAGESYSVVYLLCLEIIRNCNVYQIKTDVSHPNDITINNAFHIILKYLTQPQSYQIFSQFPIILEDYFTFLQNFTFSASRQTSLQIIFTLIKLSPKYKYAISNSQKFITIIRQQCLFNGKDNQRLVVGIIVEIIRQRDPEIDWYGWLQMLVLKGKKELKFVQEEVREMVKKGVQEWFNRRFDRKVKQKENRELFKLLEKIMEKFKGKSERRRIELRNWILREGYEQKIPEYKGDYEKEYGGDLFD